jgi:small ligand-binding sensory domain FIST
MAAWWDGGMVRCADGLGVGGDPVLAARTAVGRALRALNGAAPDLACAFVTGAEPELAAAALVVAAEESGAPTSVGCTGHGVLAEERSSQGETAVSVFLAAMPSARVRSFHLEVMRTAEAITVVGTPTRSDEDDVALVLADPATFPVDGYVGQSGTALPGLPIVGGLAHGGSRPGSTRLLVDGRVVDRGAVGVVLSGPGLRAVVSQGCRPVGPSMTVTAAEGNLITGLAGVPALEKLRRVLAGLPAGEQALVSAGLQVGVAVDEYADERGQGDFLVRGLVGRDEAGGGIAVGDVVPVGRTVRFQVRDRAAAVNDLALTLTRFRSGAGLDDVEGALVFSGGAFRGSGRGWEGAGSAGQDLRSVRSTLQARSAAGFLSAGEIGPVGGRNHVHTCSTSMLVLGNPGRER